MPRCPSPIPAANATWGTSSRRNITNCGWIRGSDFDASVAVGWGDGMHVNRAVMFVGCAIAIASSTTHAAAQTKPAPGAAAQSTAASDTADRAKVLRATADALGMVRWSDIGGGATRLPGIDAINTMEFTATGTSYAAGQPVQTEY